MPSHSLDILTSLPRVVPTKLARLAAAWPAGAAPVRPRPSASVVLCQDADAGLETYLLHRHARMAFAASMAVFPGGGLDAVDQLATDPRRACAIRETREETGVELVDDALVPWAHWITPEPHQIRYDTSFYLAALPAGQTATDTSSETADAGWIRPEEAVAAHRVGSLLLMPPTLSILLELVDLPSVTAAIELGRDRVIQTVLPRVVREGGDWVFRYPQPCSDRGADDEPGNDDG